MNRTLHSLCIFASFVALMVHRTTYAADFESIDSDEANLRSITFIDPDRGWVAGDRGVILHSQDGGLSWHNQPTPTRSDLRQIAMFNSQRGLAVGGGYRPYTRLSQGEVLTTRDGGVSWQAAKEHNLPLVRKLLIGRGGHCIAAGDWSSVYSSNLFSSKDGGETWSPIPCELVGNAVDIAGSIDDFIVLSDRGQLCRVRGQTNCETLSPPTSLFCRNEERMPWLRLMGRDQEWWLVGRDAVVSTTDAGRSWQTQPQTPLTDLLLASSSGSLPYVWFEQQLCVSPGLGRELISVMDGNTVISRKAVPTSTHAVCHLDGQRLWACGDSGMIVSSRDQGKTWRTLRGGQPGVALLIVSSDPAAMPWNLLATESLQSNRRVGIASMHPHRTVMTTDNDRLRQAANQLGPSVVYSLMDDSPTIDRDIQTCLQLARPAVVIIDQNVSGAIRERWAALSLESGVKRLLEVTDRAGQTIHVSAAIPATGCLSSDYWYDADAILSPGRSVPGKLMLNARFDSTGAALLSDGLAGFTARDVQYTLTRKSLPSRRNLQLLQARSMEASWKTGLLRSADSDPVAYQTGLQSILSRMQPQDRDRLWVELSMATNRQPTPEAYQQTLLFLTQAIDASTVGNTQAGGAGFGVKPTTDDLRKLAQLRWSAIQRSSEWQLAFGGLNANSSANQSLHRSEAVSDSQISLAVEWSPFKQATNSARDASQASSVTQASYVDSGAPTGAVTTGNRSDNLLTSNNVDLYWDTHPLVALQIEKSQLATNQDPKLLNSNAAMGRLGSMLSANRSARDWSRLLSPGTFADPANELRVATATERPFLDGKFDESWWAPAVPVGIRQTAVNATVRVASDQEFVYLAITVPHFKSSLSGTEQKRDTDLGDQRRFRLRLDTDRDLLTWFEFEFDGNGNTRESCDGFVAFDPRWYVASHVAGGTQQVEIAIQKADLGLASDHAAVTWLASLDLQLPGEQSQSLWLPEPTEWFPITLP